jgi:hypothetical protein
LRLGFMVGTFVTVEFPGFPCADGGAFGLPVARSGTLGVLVDPAGATVVAKGADVGPVGVAAHKYVLV